MRGAEDAFSSLRSDSGPIVRLVTSGKDDERLRFVDTVLYDPSFGAGSTAE
jgi:hypothetical protein